MGLYNYFHYWRNYVSSRSGIAGCDCTVLSCIQEDHYTLDLTRFIHG